ncbi:MAG: hypothetical protein IKN49_02620 [Elusimicrobiaceae bacterium]|nr:hypothetical protein [Elusimicrobiaceae bacterium]
MNKSFVIDYDNLYNSGLKCKKGVIWKPSVSSFILNQIERTNQLCDELEAGTYKSLAPKPIKITHPKPRDGLCISFRDRVYQRSLNDNALYPMITNAFIYDNAACQKGKGTDFARGRIKKFLWNYFCNYGPEGYVLHIDIKGYYPSMRHDVVKNKFAKMVPDDIYGMAAKILDTQYSGTVGYNPGSQMVQIAGIGVLDDVDHFCKEQLHIKYYLRYMDDTIIIHNDKNTLKNWLEIIGKQLNNLGFEININKTKIYPLCRGFLFLGFTFRLTETGKVVLSIDGQNVKAEKRKLKRLVNKARKGTLTKAKVYECYNAWKAHASVGNSNKLIQRMDSYFKNLWR